MTFRWQYSNGEFSGLFPSQAEAETWLGEMWQELLSGGVEDVSLLEEQRTVYGPMSLRAGT